MSKQTFNQATDYLTIADFAEKANVSKQAIYKKLREKPEFRAYSAVINGTKVIRKTALYDFFGVESEPDPEVIEPQNNQQHEIIQLLKEQLQTKDRQIADLTEALMNSQKLQGILSARIALLEDQHVNKNDLQEHGLEQDSDGQRENECASEMSEPGQSKTDRQVTEDTPDTFWKRLRKRFKVFQ